MEIIKVGKTWLNTGKRGGWSLHHVPQHWTWPGLPDPGVIPAGKGTSPLRAGKVLWGKAGPRVPGRDGMGHPAPKPGALEPSGKLIKTSRV